jgi:hypothetical protein
MMPFTDFYNQNPAKRKICKSIVIKNFKRRPVKHNFKFLKKLLTNYGKKYNVHQFINV